MRFYSDTKALTGTQRQSSTDQGEQTYDRHPEALGREAAEPLRAGIPNKGFLSGSME
jgi:hypothetical protein